MDGNALGILFYVLMAFEAHFSFVSATPLKQTPWISPMSPPTPETSKGAPSFEKLKQQDPEKQQLAHHLEHLDLFLAFPWHAGTTP